MMYVYHRQSNQSGNSWRLNSSELPQCAIPTVLFGPSSKTLLGRSVSRKVCRSLLRSLLGPTGLTTTPAAFTANFITRPSVTPSFKFGVVGPQNLQLEASRPITVDENSKPKPRLKVADEQTLFSSSSRITTAYSTCLATNFSVASWKKRMLQ